MSKESNVLEHRLSSIRSSDDGYILLASVVVEGISEGLRSALKNRDSDSIEYWSGVIRSSWYSNLTMNLVEPDDVIRTLAAQCGVESPLEDVAAC